MKASCFASYPVISHDRSKAIDVDKAGDSGTDRIGDKGLRRFGVLGKTIWRLEHLYRLIGVDIIKRGFAGYLFVRTGPQ